MNVKQVKVKEIIVEENSRWEESDVSMLMESMKQHGLLQPIGVVPNDDDKYNYKIAYGVRRFKAAQKLGWTCIDAVIRPKDSDEDFYILNLVENIQRLNNSPFEVGRFATILRDTYKLNPREIAARCGFSKHQIHDALKIFEAFSEKIGRKIVYKQAGMSPLDREKSVSSSMASKIANLAYSIGLSKKKSDAFVEYFHSHNLGTTDAELVGFLMRYKSLTFKQAIKEMKNYSLRTARIWCDTEELTQRLDATKKNASALLRDIVFGKEKPLKKEKELKA